MIITISNTFINTFILFSSITTGFILSSTIVATCIWKPMKVKSKKDLKAFRELFGEIEDVRHSIFEGMNRLSVVARKNQLFDEILDVDDAMKAKIT